MNTQLLNGLALKKDFVLAKEINKEFVFQFYPSEKGLEKILFHVLYSCLLKCNLQRVLINIFRQLWTLLMMYGLTTTYNIINKLF